ncbi:MAG TPA: LptF/LptG family permease [Candidatus Omnitrophota bacterium]|nr:LptF/LptG family permease [Candidatus Omnitrophota bacterium]
MKILRTYLLKEFSLPFVFSLIVLIFVMLLGNLFQLIELIITKGVNFFSVAKLFLFLVPYLLTYTIPIAILAAVLLSLGRLSSDNEILAIRASGINIFILIVPLLILGLLLSLFLVILNDRIIPLAHYASRRTLIEIGIKNPTAAIEPGTFIDSFQNYVLFVYSIERNKQTGERNILNNVRIYEPQGKDKPTRTIVAKKGEFVSIPEKKVVKLKLSDGTSDEPDPNKPGEFFKLNFKTYFLTLSLDKAEGTGQIEKKPKDMTIKELKEQITEYSSEGIDTLPLITHLHQKIALAFSALVFILVAAPMAVITHRREKAVNFGLAILIILVYYLLLIGFESLSLQGYFPPVVSIWMPNIIFGLIGSCLIFRLCVS